MCSVQWLCEGTWQAIRVMSIDPLGMNVFRAIHRRLSYPNPMDKRSNVHPGSDMTRAFCPLKLTIPE